MRVKITHPIDGFRPGEVYDLPDQLADDLEARGLGSRVPSPPDGKQVQKPAEDKALRRREWKSWPK